MGHGAQDPEPVPENADAGETGLHVSNTISLAFADDRAVVVRSSAPGEDSSKTSFAGLHDSYLNIHGMDALLEHIRLVWASLWSDAALLYRRELGLDVEKSAMAVVVQEIVPGDRSGVAFGVNPNDHAQSVVEAVHGLNEGLVSGQVEPDRWILERASGRIVSHAASAEGPLCGARSGGREN